MNAHGTLGEAMRRADARADAHDANETQEIGARAIERELDPREIEAALADAVDGVALALLDKAKAVCITRIARCALDR